MTEAKYVDQSGLAEASRKSRSQLRQTVARIDDALFGDPGRLDRDLWLSRISDLLLDGTAALGQANLLERVRDGIRRGAVPIDLRGYSHIFVSGPATDGSSPGEQDELPEIQMGLQEIFTRKGLRKLIKAYEAKQSLTELRAQLGEKQTWKSVSYRHPAPRVDWTKAIKEEHPIAGMDELISHDYDQDDDEGDPEGGKVIEAVESGTNGNDSVAVSGASGLSKGKSPPPQSRPKSTAKTNRPFQYGLCQTRNRGLQRRRAAKRLLRRWTSFPAPALTSALLP
ncbi:hypothetical protein HED55_22780 [Ochrobactrum haematophilum]|uniref:Uncharacterized protein n=1 Tax=Brucella haematophila TaxID=419474 RepID=A0ABX1DQZ3_9HYPH|nr:hypothetical protein [Brucella haematophila]